LEIWLNEQLQQCCDEEKDNIESNLQTVTGENLACEGENDAILQVIYDLSGSDESFEDWKEETCSIYDGLRETGVIHLIPPEHSAIPNIPALCNEELQILIS